MEYETLLGKLREAACTAEPAACDGLVCGMLCAHDGHGVAALGRELADYLGLETGLPASLGAAIADLKARASEGFESPDFEFRPLLPDDDAPISARADAFRAWCASFLHGLGTGGMSRASELGPQAREALSDIADFTRLESPDAEDEVADEDDERALFELTEYLQVAVLLLREEFRRETPAPPSSRSPKPTLH